MSWRRLRTLIRREVLATFRDPFTLAVLVSVPLAALLVFGFVLSVQVQHMKLGVHDAGGSAASRRLVAELMAQQTFDVRPYATRDALDQAFVAGDLGAALVIPPNFDRAFDPSGAGTQRPQVQAIYDGGEAVLAGNAEAFLRGLVTATGADLVATHRRVPPHGPPPRGGGAGVQVVYDSVGKTTFDRGLDCLARRGMMVLLGASSGPVPPFDLQVLNRKGALFVTRPSLGHYTATRAELVQRSTEVLGWVQAGKLDVRIGREFPLSAAAEAHRELEGRRTTGKVLLTV